MNLLLLLGRVLFAAIFVAAGPKHFSSGMVVYAGEHGVPAAPVLVPLAGIAACLGGLMIAAGWRARTGAWLIIVFLLPVTFTMHRFWGLADAGQMMMQQVHFWKNLSMLGGAIAFAYFGAGPFSLDNRRVHGRERRRPLFDRRREPALR